MPSLFPLSPSFPNGGSTISARSNSRWGGWGRVALPSLWGTTAQQAGSQYAHQVGNITIEATENLIENLFLISHVRYCRARDEEYTVVVEDERVELGAESMVLTLEKDDLLVYQMNQQ